MSQEHASTDHLLDAVSAGLPPLLTALEVLGEAGRHLHPPRLDALVAQVAPLAAPLADGRAAFSAVDWPAGYEDFSRCIGEAMEHATAAIDGFVRSAGDPEGVYRAYRALGRGTLAQATLYPVAAMLTPVSRFFIERALRDRADIVARVASRPERDADAPPVGVLEADNAREQRGGFSLYVPEYWQPDRQWPLVVALHGGSGHGRDFLWTFLREARGRGALVLAPTSRDRTWSIIDGDDIDAAPLAELVGNVGRTWNVDPARVLLTGMSDGGTYSGLAGLAEGAPYTHLAPVAGVFHPDSMANGNLTRAAGRPVYLVHGALDWMFPVDMARMHRTILEQAGAQVTYREIADLSHTWPREETARILEWFDPTLAV